MLYSIKNIEVLKNLEELALMKNQVNKVVLQNELVNRTIIRMQKYSMNHLLMQLKIPLKTQQKLLRKLIK